MANRVIITAEPENLYQIHHNSSGTLMQEEVYECI
jgi:hypothetical protein